MTTRKKRFLAGILLLGMASFLFVVLSNQKPIPIFDNDLKPVRLTIADQENAFYFLIKATNSIYYSEDKRSEFLNLASGKDWDATFAAEVLTTNKEALAWLERALTCKELQVPAPKGIDDVYPYLSSMKLLANLAAIQANQLLRDGKESAALAMAMRIVQYGHRVENSGGALLHYLVGSAIKQIGLRQVRQIAWESTLPLPELKDCIAQLELFRPNTPGLTNALKSEYFDTVEMYDDIQSGKFSGKNSPLEQMLRSARDKLTFNLEQTKNLMGQNVRVALKNIPRHFNEMRLSEISSRSTTTSMLKMFLRGNATGEILVGFHSADLVTTLAKKCRENSVVSVTQLALALKCFQIKHGRLPDLLSELVPEFLPSIPLDDFDGKPLRYSKDRKLIWSVGRDLMDSDGAKSTQPGGPDDIPFEIEIKTAPTP